MTLDPRRAGTNVTESLEEAYQGGEVINLNATDGGVRIEDSAGGLGSSLFAVTDDGNSVQYLDVLKDEVRVADKLSFAADQDTYLDRPAADTMAVTTGGGEIWRWTASVAQAKGELQMGSNPVTGIAHLALPEQSSDPSNVADTGLAYTKDVSGATELHYRDDSGNVVQVTTGGSLVVESHASTHISGGSDEIDGDQLDIDWAPSNYTRDTSPTEVSSTAHLTAHLKGLDNHVGNTSNPHTVTTQQAYDGSPQPTVTDTLSSGGDVMITVQPTLQMTSGGAGVAHLVNPLIDGTDVNWVALRAQADLDNETVSGSPTRRLLELQTESGGTATDKMVVHADGKTEWTSGGLDVFVDPNTGNGMIGADSFGDNNGNKIIETSASLKVQRPGDANVNFSLLSSSIVLRPTGNNDRFEVSETGTPSSGDCSIVVYRYDGTSWVSKRVHTVSGDTVDANDNVLVTDSG